MTERIQLLAEQAKQSALDAMIKIADKEQALKAYSETYDTEFAHMIVQECVDKIEAYQIPVGNSAAGEMACEWTYGALKEIRDEIRQQFAVEQRAVPILSADQQALYFGIALSELFAIEGANKAFGAESLTNLKGVTVASKLCEAHEASEDPQQEKIFELTQEIIRLRGQITYLQEELSSVEDNLDKNIGWYETQIADLEQQLGDALFRS